MALSASSRFDETHWTSQDRAIARLWDRNTPRNTSIAAISRRYGLDSAAAEAAWERAGRLIECRNRRASRPKAITAAKVGAGHQDAVRAVLKHTERLTVCLLRDVANRYGHALKEDALAKVQDSLSKVLVRLQAYQAMDGVPPAHAWGDPLVKHGYRYLRSALEHAVLDDYIRPSKRHQARLEDDSRDRDTSVNTLELYLQDHELKLALLWGAAHRLCQGKTRETSDALRQTARDFGYQDTIGETLFFHSYLFKKTLPGCPERNSIKAFLSVHLGTLNANALDQRVFRLKAIWRLALAEFHRSLKGAA